MLAVRSPYIAAVPAS